MTNGNVVAGAVIGLAVGWLTAGREEKSNDLRLWDVVALGPWLVILATRQRQLAPWERFALAVAGGATVTHNARNMLTAAGRPF